MKSKMRKTLEAVVLGSLLSFGACTDNNQQEKKDFYDEEVHVVKGQTGEFVLRDEGKEGAVTTINNTYLPSAMFLAPGYETKSRFYNPENTKAMPDDLRNAASVLVKAMDDFDYQMARARGGVKESVSLSTPTVSQSQPDQPIYFWDFPSEKKYNLTPEEYCALKNKKLSNYEVIGVNSYRSIENPSRIESIVNINCSNNTCHALALIPKLDKSKLEAQ